MRWSFKSCESKSTRVKPKEIAGLVIRDYLEIMVVNNLQKKIRPAISFVLGGAYAP